MSETDEDWSRWIRIADHKNFDIDLIDDCGPACYELGLKVRGSWFGSVEPMYIGETCNLRLRASAYGRDGSHLNEIIHHHLKRGYDLYMRFQLFHTKEFAKAFQDEQHDEFDYDWNIMRDGDSTNDEE